MKKCAKRLCTLALALCMTMALGVTASATEVNSNGTEGQSALTLDVTAATFSVTVPTTLTFAIAGDGTVTSPTGSIVNNGGGPVDITEVALAATNGWTIKAWADDSFKGTPVNTKEMMLKMNGTAFGADGSYAGSVKGATINGKDSLALTFDADFAEQSGAVAGNIATITFTIGWHTAD